MQPRYMRALLSLPLGSVRTLERVFRLPRKGSLYFRLCEAEIDHADATLALLAERDFDGVEILLGHPIVICPACLQKLHAPSIVRRLPGEEKVLVYVARNPRLPTTDSFFRFACLKAGMTVSQARLRGVRERDLREWNAEGSIRIERRGNNETRSA